MAEVYISKLSDAYQIEVQTNLDFTTDDISSAKILYIDPDGTTGEWSATKLAGSESDGVVYYMLPMGSPLSIGGIWSFRAQLTYSDGRVLYTEWVKQHVGE